ncbi:MAG TPA: DUF3450 domain-containing protein [Nitrosomonas nitrosa]|nr:DUF3450 family protein [Nitrosomonas nitrosa]HBZ30644.1 DUF3450 domain-containing protein [Nitrosomonas nitrosa]
MWKIFMKLLDIFVALIGIMIITLYAPKVMADNLDNLAKSLAKIRGEVEELQSQLDLEKENHSSRIAALSSQLADLSVEERRQKVSIEKLQQSLEQLTANSKEAERSGENLKPLLLEFLSAYKHHVQQGLPFRVEDRIKAIEELESNVTNKLVDSKKAVNQAWSLIEDEIRLSKENGLYQQTILLNEEKILADIAKLGTVFLFFQTRDNRAGMAQRVGDAGWKFVVVDSNKDKERIAKLFDALKKQIRQGYFELPNPLKKL